LIPFPNVEAAWRASQSALNSLIEQGIADAYSIRSWVRLTEEIKQNDPRFLRQVKFPDAFTGQLGQLLSIVDERADTDPFLDSPEELREEAGELSSLADLVERVGALAPNYAEQSSELAGKLSDESSRLERSAEKREPEEPDYDDDMEEREAPFDIEGLFSDL
jgi:hypothetical protein